MKKFIYCFLLILAACGGGGNGGSGGGDIVTPPQNTAPTAYAGSDISQSISPPPISLDAIGSSDPQNDAITFSWQVTAQPPSVSVTLNDSTISNPNFESMVPGDYEFELTVTDPAGLSGTDTVVVTLINDPPTISVAEFDRNPTIGDNVTIDASASVDPNGHSITYSWELTQLPGDSGMQTTYQGASPTLRFDADGDYVLQLQVTDTYDPSTVVWDPIIVTVFHTSLLTNEFKDAEFDKIGKRIVTVLDDTLFVIEADGTENSVALPTIATAVSVSSDGATAAVAYDGWISHVDLNTRSVIATHSVPANLGDVVIDGQGYAYGFPETGQWVNIEVLNLMTGAVQASTGGSVRHRTRAKLHPSGNKIYGADNGLSPSDLERYSIGGGTANLDYDSPYHGDFPFCGDLWLGPDGNTILSRCRVVVRATDDQASDLGFVMQLDNLSSTIAHASSSAFENAWFVIDGNANTGSNDVKAYDVESGNHTDTFDLPFVDSSFSQTWIAKYVFATDDSTSIHVLAVDDDASPQAFALLQRVDPTFSNSNFAPEAIVRRYSTLRIFDTVTLDASASSDPEGQA